MSWYSVLRTTHSSRRLQSARRLQLEPLEDRHLLSLLGVTPDVPLTEYNSTGVIVYQEASDAFSLQATPTDFYEVAGPTATGFYFPGASVAISISVGSDGALLDGTGGFVLTGDLDTNYDFVPEYSGALLIGNVTAFGFEDSGSATDRFDFIFEVTGGALSAGFAEFAVGSSVGVYCTSEGSTFTNDFSVNFGGGAKGRFGHVEPLVQPSSLSGNVFDDLNNNGLLEPGLGETGIAGASVVLTGTDVDGAAVNLTATTGPDGAYSFTDLLQGAYTLTEEQPDGYLDGQDALGTQGGTLGNDIIADIDLAAGVDGTANNFGELAPASLAGNVYMDDDNDGVMQSGEVGIPGVAIALTGADELGAVNLSTTTDGDGAYRFNNLRPGTYVITEMQPAGYLDGQDAVGTQGGTLGNDVLSDILLAAGVSGVDNNFGELPQPPALSSLAGFVYLDDNGDGIMQVGELGIADVIVTLSGTDDLGGVVSLSTTTGSDGAYAFLDLQSGVYVITETQPTEYLDGQDAVGTQGGTLGNDILSDIVLAAGVDGTANNFGELPQVQLPPSLAGFVYVDANNDGIKQTGESGIEGVMIILSGTDYLGQTVVLTTTTDANGAYSFTDLLPGAYKLTEIQPTGGGGGCGCWGSWMCQWWEGGAYHFGMFGCDGLPQECSTSSSFSLIDNLFDQMINQQWFDDSLDWDDEGLCDALFRRDEPGDLFDWNDPQESYFGQYFSNFWSGCPVLFGSGGFTRYLDGKDTIGTQGGLAGNDVLTDIVLDWNVNGTDNNFGELLPASLAGSVYVDANNDAVRQLGEKGIARVKVTLTGADDLGNAVTLTTFTDCRGGYSFNNLRPGTYTLTETDPACYVDGKDTIGAQGGIVGDDVLSDIVLASGVEGTGNLFGELKAASLSGFVFVDKNGNGDIDCRDVALTDVAITLTGVDDLGNAVSLTALTDENGFYIFKDLRPGVYAITETQPAGYLDGIDTIGSQGGTVGNDQFTNIVLNQGVRGVNNNFAELVDASLALHEGQTATIGFWNNKNGQNLIKSLNGGPTATALGNWLAENFDNMYGENAGVFNLAGKTNAQIANFFKQLFSVRGMKVDAQALAVALACYVTNVNLAGNVAANYGFLVDTVGTGAATYNIGCAGAAFGVDNHSTLTILEILQRTNDRARNGILWDADGSGTISWAEQLLRTLGNNVFSGINETGDIG